MVLSIPQPGEELGAPSSRVRLSSCSENPLFPGFCSSRALSRCSASAGWLESSPAGETESPPLIPAPGSRALRPPSRRPPRAPFPGFHPKPAAFIPRLRLWLRAELRAGFGDHPHPAGIPRERAGSGEKGPPGAAEPRAAAVWVGKAGFGPFFALRAGMNPPRGCGVLAAGGGPGAPEPGLDREGR